MPLLAVQPRVKTLTYRCTITKLRRSIFVLSAILTLGAHLWPGDLTIAHHRALGLRVLSLLFEELSANYNNSEAPFFFFW